MKKIISFTLCVLAVFMLCGCERAKEPNVKEAVVINMPDDDTVNGYRKYSSESNANGEGYNNATGEYCVNVNSRVFHKSSCSSVSKMKDENKLFLNDREKAVAEGYRPCGACKP